MNDDILTKLINNYFSLRDKISNFDNQSIYFIWGIESNLRRLEFYFKEFIEIKEIINNHSKEDFIKELEKNEILYQFRQKENKDSKFQCFAYSFYERIKTKLENNLQIKNKYHFIENISFYEQNLER